MKRILSVILVLLLLTGCGAPAAATTQSTTAEHTASPETTQVQLPGYYDPDHPMESTTGGAVRVYPLGTEECAGVEIMGDDVLLFLMDGDNTRLSLLTDEQLREKTNAVLDTYVFPGEPDVRVNERGVGYYDADANAVVFLDTQLQETSRIQVPDVVQGTPVLTRDWSTIYYCTDTAIRGLDMESGIPRLVRGDYPCQWQSLNQLYLEDTVLKYSLSVDGDTTETYFISTDTGELLYSGHNLYELETNGDTFFANIQDSFMTEYIHGTVGDEAVKTLLPEGDTVTVYPALEMGGVFTVQWFEEYLVLEFYDLSSGRKIASVRLDGVDSISDYAVDTTHQWIWLLGSNDETDYQSLYRWEPALSRIEDQQIYTADFERSGNPENPGIAECEARARVMGARYGVEICVGAEVLEDQPIDYVLQREYKSVALNAGLDMLEKGLAAFPSGFLRQAAERTDSGKIRINLVRDVTGDVRYGSLTEIQGIQYWTDDGNAYIALVLDDSLEQDLYHEIFHVLDSYVLSSCVAYDDWENLNPYGFEYDYDYIANANRADVDYLYEDDRAFIDQYSMSFPSEDRARVMEYAMMPDNALYFESDMLQAKLSQLCLGIRQAFGMEEDPRVLPWEQYLRK